MSPLPDIRLVSCHQQLTEAGYRCYVLRIRLGAYEARLVPAQLTSSALVVLLLLVVILLVAAYGVDVLLLRALAEYVTGLASSGLERVARWLVPGLILGLEVFVSTARAREHTTTVVATDPFAIYDPKPQHQDTIWKVLGGLLLLVQPLGAGATYQALVSAGPSVGTQINELLLGFLVCVGVTAHLAVLLFSGRYLIALAGAIEQRAINANRRKTRAAYLTACLELLRLYQHYHLLRDQHPNEALSIDPLVATEIQHALQLGQSPTTPTTPVQEPPPTPAPPKPPTPTHASAPGSSPGPPQDTAPPNQPPSGLPDPPNPYAPASNHWGDDERL